MKKNLFLSFFMFYCFCAFAEKNSLELFVSPVFYTEKYEVDEKNFLTLDGSAFNAGLCNYNFFGSRQAFGFFEKLGFYNKDDFSFDLMLGAAFGCDAADGIRLNCGPAIHLGYGLEKGNQIYTSDSIDINSFFCGIGADFKIKFFADKRFSPVAGFDLNWDFYSRGGVFHNGDFFYLDYKEFSSVYIRPYAAFCWNIR